MTPFQIANKHYPNSQFNECKMSCMRCDEGVCEAQEEAIITLTKDIFECLKTFNTKEK
jgi:hypothetical protein